MHCWQEGYRDGIETGEEDALQDGHDNGFQQTCCLFHLARIRGSVVYVSQSQCLLTLLVMDRWSFELSGKLWQPISGCVRETIRDRATVTDCGTVAGNHMCPVKPCHFHWPWVSFEGHFVGLLRPPNSFNPLTVTKRLVNLWLGSLGSDRAWLDHLTRQVKLRDDDDWWWRHHS